MILRELARWVGERRLPFKFLDADKERFPQIPGRDGYDAVSPTSGEREEQTVNQLSV